MIQAFQPTTTFRVSKNTRGITTGDGGAGITEEGIGNNFHSSDDFESSDE